jgi:cell division protease FtsH
LPKPLRQLMLIIALSVAVLMVLNAVQSHSPAQELKYSDFIQAVSDGRIATATLKGDQITGTFSKPEAGKPENFKTTFRREVKPSPEEVLLEHKVATEIKQDKGIEWWGVLLQGLPFILVFFFFMLIMRQASGSGNQAFAFGRSKHKLVSDNRVKATFEDVAGVEEAKEELAEVVDYLKFPKKYQTLGARIPKGVLLLGAPGTGKTLLGRAVAGEAGVPFFYISGSDFVEMFVGVGASRVRDLFEQAKKSAPCIVFVDEIDAVGRQRGAGLGGGHDEREQTLNQLLVEMDGFYSSPVTPAVIVLAATNRPDVLDPALLRPGRFDRQVVVDKPDIAGRLAILKVHSRGKPLGADINLQDLAQRTPGFSGADLENLLNEAALLAARVGKDRIEMEDCTEAIDRVLMGPERKSRVISEKEREVTAYHEGGHALVARAIPEADPVRKITILPRGMTLGVTSLVPDEDRYNMTQAELLANIAVFMGGRVAEEIIFNEISTGASNDIERATELARDMVCRYGMSPVVGPLHFGRKQSKVFLGRDIVENRNFSEETSRTIDAEVHRLVSESYERARTILTENREQLDLLARVLMEKEVIEASELEDMLGPAARDADNERSASPIITVKHPDLENDWLQSPSDLS